MSNEGKQRERARADWNKGTGTVERKTAKSRKHNKKVDKEVKLQRECNMKQENVCVILV